MFFSLILKPIPKKKKNTILSIAIHLTISLKFLGSLLTWFWRKNWAWAGSCPAAAGLACWNMANCWSCCCSDCCCCWSVEARAWISWGLRAPSEPCMRSCWPTSWAARAACWELLVLPAWLPVSWLLTPDDGEEALPLVPLLLLRCDTSVTWTKGEDV